MSRCHYGACSSSSMNIRRVNRSIMILKTCEVVLKISYLLPKACLAVDVDVQGQHSFSSQIAPFKNSTICYIVVAGHLNF